MARLADGDVLQGMIEVGEIDDHSHRWAEAAGGLLDGGG